MLPTQQACVFVCSFSFLSDRVSEPIPKCCLYNRLIPPQQPLACGERVWEKKRGKKITTDIVDVVTGGVLLRVCVSTQVWAFCVCVHVACSCMCVSGGRGECDV